MLESNKYEILIFNSIKSVFKIINNIYTDENNYKDILESIYNIIENNLEYLQSEENHLKENLSNIIKEITNICNEIGINNNSNINDDSLLLLTEDLLDRENIKNFIKNFKISEIENKCLSIELVNKVNIYQSELDKIKLVRSDICDSIKECKVELKEYNSIISIISDISSDIYIEENDKNLLEILYEYLNELKSIKSKITNIEEIKNNLIEDINNISNELKLPVNELKLPVNQILKKCNNEGSSNEGSIEGGSNDKNNISSLNNIKGLNNENIIKGLNNNSNISIIPDIPNIPNTSNVSNISNIPNTSNLNIIRELINIKKMLSLKLKENKLKFNSLEKEISKLHKIFLMLDPKFITVDFDFVYSLKYLKMMEEYLENLNKEKVTKISSLFNSSIINLLEIIRKFINSGNQPTLVELGESEILEYAGNKLTNKSKVEDYTKLIENIKNRNIEDTSIIEDISVLIAELTNKLPYFVKLENLVRERYKLIKSMEEFEISASDPKRLFRSSFQLNKEEKFRKSAYPNLLKLEESIFSNIILYEQMFNSSFYYSKDSDILYKNILRDEIENRVINKSVLLFMSGKEYNRKRNKK